MTILSDKRPHHPSLSDEEMYQIVWEMIEESGGLKKVLQDMQAFKKTTSKLSKDYSRLIETHNNKWVAYYDCRLQAHADTHEELLEKIDAMGIPRNGLATRYVTDKPEKWIL